MDSHNQITQNEVLQQRLENIAFEQKLNEQLLKLQKDNQSAIVKGQKRLQRSQHGRAIEAESQSPGAFSGSYSGETGMKKDEFSTLGKSIKFVDQNFDQKTQTYFIYQSQKSELQDLHHSTSRSQLTFNSPLSSPKPLTATNHFSSTQRNKELAKLSTLNTRRKYLEKFKHPLQVFKKPIVQQPIKSPKNNSSPRLEDEGHQINLVSNRYIDNTKSPHVSEIIDEKKESINDRLVQGSVSGSKNETSELTILDNIRFQSLTQRGVQVLDSEAVVLQNKVDEEVEGLKNGRRTSVYEDRKFSKQSTMKSDPFSLPDPTCQSQIHKLPQCKTAQLTLQITQHESVQSKRCDFEIPSYRNQQTEEVSQGLKQAKLGSFEATQRQQSTVKPQVSRQVRAFQDSDMMSDGGCLDMMDNLFTQSEIHDVIQSSKPSFKPLSTQNFAFGNKNHLAFKGLRIQSKNLHTPMKKKLIQQRRIITQPSQTPSQENNRVIRTNEEKLKLSKYANTQPTLWLQGAIRRGKKQRQIAHKRASQLTYKACITNSPNKKFSNTQSPSLSLIGTHPDPNLLYFNSPSNIVSSPHSRHSQQPNQRYMSHFSRLTSSRYMKPHICYQSRESKREVIKFKEDTKQRIDIDVREMSSDENQKKRIAVNVGELFMEGDQTRRITDDLREVSADGHQILPAYNFNLSFEPQQKLQSHYSRSSSAHSVKNAIAAQNGLATHNGFAIQNAIATQTGIATRNGIATQISFATPSVTISGRQPKATNCSEQSSSRKSAKKEGAILLYNEHQIEAAEQSIDLDSKNDECVGKKYDAAQLSPRHITAKEEDVNEIKNNSQDIQQNQKQSAGKNIARNSNSRPVTSKNSFATQAKISSNKFDFNALLSMLDRSKADQRHPGRPQYGPNLEQKSSKKFGRANSSSNMAFNNQCYYNQDLMISKMQKESTKDDCPNSRSNLQPLKISSYCKQPNQQIQRGNSVQVFDANRDSHNNVHRNNEQKLSLFGRSIHSPKKAKSRRVLHAAHSPDAMKRKVQPKLTKSAEVRVKIDAACERYKQQEDNGYNDDCHTMVAKQITVDNETPQKIQSPAIHAYRMISNFTAQELPAKDYLTGEIPHRQRQTGNNTAILEKTNSFTPQ